MDEYICINLFSILWDGVKYIDYNVKRVLFNSKQYAIFFKKENYFNFEKHL